MMPGIVGIPRRAVVHIETGDTDADLVHVGLSNKESASRSHPGYGGRVRGRGPATQEAGAERGAVGYLIYFILHGDGNTIERANRPTVLKASCGSASLSHHVFVIAFDEGAKGLVASVTLCNCPENFPGYSFRGRDAGPVGCGEIPDRFVNERLPCGGRGLRRMAPRGLCAAGWEDWQKRWWIVELKIPNSAQSSVTKQASDQNPTCGWIFKQPRDGAKTSSC